MSLERAAFGWDIRRTSPFQTLTEAQVANWTGKLSKEASKLQNLITSLPDEVWFHLSHASGHLNRSLYEPRIYMGAGQDEGKLIPTISGDHTTREASYEITNYVLIEALRTIANIAEITPHAYTSIKKGNRKDFPLESWMMDALKIWTSMLGRKFSRDVSETGEPATAAAAFVVTAYNTLSPETPRSRVLNEMKKLITLQNEFRQK